MIRATRATCVVEAGTSFGVSTIWEALGVGHNVAAAGEAGGRRARVIATENEESKARKAREYWGRAPREEVGKWIELREGDLRETLREGIEEGEVDLVLLDSECDSWSVERRLDDARADD
jgi:predicted O-methyltransferase YrrM